MNLEQLFNPKKTIAGTLAMFNNAITDLKKIAAAAAQEAEHTDRLIDDLNAIKDESMREHEVATNYANGIEKLLEGMQTPKVDEMPQAAEYSSILKK